MHFVTMAFVTRRANALHGLHTALIGGLCLAWALWTLRADTTVGPGLAIMVLVGIGVTEEWVSMYYRRRVGVVEPRHPIRRWMTRIALGMTLTATGLWDLLTDGPWLAMPLAVAAMHLHVALVSGYPYQWHYAGAALLWTAVSGLPMLDLSPDTARAVWLAAAGVALIAVGWADHRLLTRVLTPEGDHDHRR